jgi:hypothetical protein
MPLCQERTKTERRDEARMGILISVEIARKTDECQTKTKRLRLSFITSFTHANHTFIFYLSTFDWWHGARAAEFQLDWLGWLFLLVVWGAKQMRLFSVKKP